MNTLFTATALLLFCGAGAQAVGQDAVPLGEAEAEAYLFRLEELEGLRIDINRTTAGELQALPWVTPQLARRLVSARNRAGGFRTLADLSEIEGVTPELLAAIDPYLSISRSPGFRFSYTGRISRPAGKPDSWDGLRVYHRLQSTIGGRTQAFVLTERDPSEPGLADFATGHLLVKNAAGTARLVLGDFRPAFGQGLVLSRQSRAGSGLASARAASAGRIVYTSSQESGALRGICASLSGGRYALTAFLARAAWDANLDEQGVASVKLSGEHSSLTQIRQKGALSERAVGARLAVSVSGGHIGLSGLGSVYNTRVAAFNGPSRRRADVSIDCVSDGRWGTAFCEFARTSAGPVAWLAGTRFKAGGLRVAVLAREYQPGFGNARGGAFAAYSGSPDNERGIYAGAAWRPMAGSLVEAGLDRHHRILPEGKAPVPARGDRLSLNVSRRLHRNTEIRIDLRYDTETVADRDHAGDRTRRRVRIQIRSRRGLLALRPWAASGWSTSPDGVGRGRALGLLARLGNTRYARLDGWLALFRVSDYDARIYTATPDVWGGSRLSVLSGSGAAVGTRLGVGLGRLRVCVRADWKHTGSQRSASWALQIDLDRGK